MSRMAPVQPFSASGIVRADAPVRPRPTSGQTGIAPAPVILSEAKDLHPLERSHSREHVAQGFSPACGAVGVADLKGSP